MYQSGIHVPELRYVEVSSFSCDDNSSSRPSGYSNESRVSSRPSWPSLTKQLPIQRSHTTLTKTHSSSNIDEYFYRAEEICGIRLCDEEVEEFSKGDMWAGKVVPMGLCTGPAIPIARRSAIVGWSALALFSFLCYMLAQCDTDGFVFYPWQLWIVFCPLVVIKLYWQTQCLKYTTIPYMQVAGPFKVLRCLDWGLAPWFFITSLMSLGQTLDYGTDSFFIAVVLRAGQCPESKVEALWHEVISQSKLSWFASFTFGQLALLSYIIMFLQPLVAFAATTPRWCCWDPTDYSVGAARTEFQNFFGTKKNFGDALFDLADVADMASIQLQSPAFPLTKAEQAWDSIENSREKVQRVSSFIHNALNRSLGRIGLVTCLENAYQMNLQVSILGLFLFIAENGSENEKDAHIMAKMQLQTKVSILLGMIQALARLGEVRLILQFSWWSIRQFWSERQSIAEYNSSEGSHDENSSNLSEDQFNICAQILWVVAKAMIVIVATCGFMVSSTYAIIKFYNVLWVCPDRLWNVGGCVDMSRFKK